MKGRSITYAIVSSILSVVFLAATPALAVTPQISTGLYHNVALMADGTVWTWGGNAEGQLCNGITSTGESEPQPIPGVTTAVSIAAGDNTTFIVKADGSLWACGQNTLYRLGLGTFTTREPTLQQVKNDAATFITDVVAVTAWATTTLALKSDGTVWGWGANEGKLGTGVSTPSFLTYPVQSLLSDITAISAGYLHTMALDSFGDVWTFGLDDFGQLGQAGSAQLFTPTKVTELDIPTVVTITAGQYHSLAVTDTGDLWGWGRNNYGQLGTGNTIATDAWPNGFQDLPVLAQAASGLISLSSNESHSMGIKAGATNSVQAWGKNDPFLAGTNFYNSRGALGTGNETNYLLPTDAPLWGSGTVNVAVQTGRTHSIALVDGKVFASGENEVGQLGDNVSTIGYIVTPAAVRVCGDTLDLDLNSLSDPCGAGGDADGDGVPDASDVCPGFDDNLDADGDGVPDGCDLCPGADDLLDTDSDGTPDCLDNCPADINKTDPGTCGCGTSDIDSDSDGICAATDPNDNDANLLYAGISSITYPATTNIQGGNPKVDIDFTFGVDVDHADAVSVWLVLDGHPLEMTCSGTVPDLTCTLTSRLGPVPNLTYRFEVYDSADRSGTNLVSSLDINGPTVELLNGPNMVGLARDVATTTGLQTLLGSSGVYNWQSGGLTNVLNGENQGNFLALGNTTPNTHVSGEGYFIVREQSTIPAPTMAEPLTVAATISVDLQPGWNIISNPYSGLVMLSDLEVQQDAAAPVTWATAASNSWLDNAIYYYDGIDWGSTYSFESADGLPDATLTPWLSYWVYLRVDDGSTYQLIFSKP